MKKVRLAMMAAAMFLGVSTVARAQDPQQQSRGNRPNMAAILFKDITLTPVQQAKVDSITGKYREQMQALRAAGGDQQEMRTKNRELQEKQRDENDDGKSPHEDFAHMRREFQALQLLLHFVTPRAR